MGIRWHQTCSVYARYVLQLSPPLTCPTEIRQIHCESCNLCGVFCDEVNPAPKSKLSPPGLGQAAAPAACGWAGRGGDRRRASTVGLAFNQNQTKKEKKKKVYLIFWLSHHFLKSWHGPYNPIWTLCACDLNMLIITPRSCHLIFFLKLFSQILELVQFPFQLSPFSRTTRAHCRDHFSEITEQISSANTYSSHYTNPLYPAPARCCS